MLKIKHLVIACVVVGGVCLIPAGLLFWQVYVLKGENAALASQLDITSTAITESLQRAETQLTKNSRDLESFAEQNHINLEKVKDDLNSLGARLEAVSTAVAKTATTQQSNQGSSSTSPNPDASTVPVCPDSNDPIDVHGYTQEIQEYRLNNDDGMTIADVEFDASNDHPWSSSVYGVNYFINTTVGRMDDGRLVLHSELLTENPEVQPGEYFRVEGVVSKVVQLEEPTEFQPWDPHLYLMAQFGVGVWPNIEFSASLALGFSVMTYGDWSFIGIGAGFDGVNMSFIASFFPFSYNIGGPLPFLCDLHLFPFVSIDHRSEVAVGIGISTRL